MQQDFIGLKISSYTTMSTPLIRSGFDPFFRCAVTRVIGPGGELILFYRDLTVSFQTYFRITINWTD